MSDLHCKVQVVTGQHKNNRIAKNVHSTKEAKFSVYAVVNQTISDGDMYFGTAKHVYQLTLFIFVFLLLELSRTF